MRFHNLNSGKQSGDDHTERLDPLLPVSVSFHETLTSAEAQ
jgi:hypothetical protein